MSASIEQHPDRAVIATYQNHRMACHVTRSKIPGVWYFRFVANIDPAFVEDAAPFFFQTLRIGEHTAIHPKQSGVLIVDDKILSRFIHDGSSAPAGSPLA